MDKVVAAIAPTSDDLVLEVGPGHGALTLVLANRVRRLLAIELDTELARRLAPRVPANVEVVQADFLRVDLVEAAAALRTAGDGPPALGHPLQAEDRAVAALRTAGDGPPAPLRIAGNLPYVVSAPILLRLLRGAAAAGIRDAVVMLQREVAARVVAEARSRAYGPLAVMTALHADARSMLAVPAGAFRPVPKVQSAVVSLRFRAPVRVPADPAVFESMVRRLFTRRRKQLVNALAAYAPARDLDPLTVCRGADLAPTRRPDTLDLSELIDLADVLARMVR